jgi:arabinan endo-1,5-alpha-L-arabinosidase
MRPIYLILLFSVCHAASARQLQTNIQVHDPVMIKQDSVYYLFCTGRGISVWSSVNLKDWKRENPVFANPPQWALQAVPGYRGHTWAPDISYYNGLYYLYYSVSAFGKNTSCIGVATNKTLHPASPDFRWTDHGKVIQSVPGRDMWNAIDPNLVIDDKDTAWLSFGSFWNGLKLVKLNKDLLTVAEPQEWRSIASRKLQYYSPDTSAGDGAIEAPFIFKKDNYYYLFASVDYCCRGVNSTYKMIVGRSSVVTGPYIDKAGVPLLKSGGTVVLQGDKNWHGVGHNATYTFNGKDYLVFHGYDAADNGRSKLLIKTLKWIDGWPVVHEE